VAVQSERADIIASSTWDTSCYKRGKERGREEERGEERGRKK
jgi:hypothetical protein